MICQGASPFCIDPALVVKGPGDLRRVHQGDGGWHQKPSIAGAARVTSGDAGWLAARPPGIRGSVEGVPGRSASTRGAIAWCAWPVACRRRRTLRCAASDVRSWRGALGVARDGTGHDSQYSRSGEADGSLMIRPEGQPSQTSQMIFRTTRFGLPAGN